MGSPFKWLIFKLITGLVFFNSEIVIAKDLQPGVKFNQISIELGNKKLKVDLAKTPEQQQKGMMYREKLKENEGMLFVFNTEETLSFWMKNTLVNLSIAYIDKNLKIIDIQEMKATSPLSITEPPTYPSKKPAMYALEMPKGWFKKNKIKVGQTVKILDKID